jgi:membrane protein YdbS with pleckstrin-like domain
MSISVKGRLAIVALIALAGFASSVLKLYLGLLCVSLLVSFAIVGVVSWLVERLARQRNWNGERRQRHRRRYSSRIADSEPLPISRVDHVDTHSTAGRL